MPWLFLRLLRFRWALALRLARWIVIASRNAHGRLEPEERARLGDLLIGSRGRPRRLSRGQRSEVARLALKAVGRLS
jgi:hypothetical protein